MGLAGLKAEMIVAVLLWYAGTGMYNVIIKWSFSHKPSDDPEAAKLPILATTLQSGVGVLLCVAYIQLKFRAKGLHEMRLIVDNNVLTLAPLALAHFTGFLLTTYSICNGTLPLQSQ